MSARSRKGSRPTQEAVDGPFLTVAVICEKVLREKDDVQSLIRIYDKITVWRQPEKEPSAEKSRLIIPLTLFVAFKSAGFVGSKNLSIKPIGREGQAKHVPVVFTGDEAGPVVVSEVVLEVKKAELLWFEIALDDQPVTRVPLRIEFEEKTTPPSPTPSKSVPGARSSKK